MPTGIVSWWTGDGNADDLVGSNDGTSTGAVAYTAGMVGQAFEFAGEDYVAAPTANFPSGTADRTVEGWVRFDQPYPGASTQGLFFGYGSWGNATGTIELLVNGGGTQTNALTFSQWGGAVFQSSQATQGVWYHLAITISNGAETLYVNGSIVSSGAFAVNTPAGTMAYLGAYPNTAVGGTEWLTGAVDEISVYSRALQSTEIQSIYAAGKSGKCKSGAGVTAASGGGKSSGDAGGLACSTRAVPAMLIVPGNCPSTSSGAPPPTPCGTGTTNLGVEGCCCNSSVNITLECVPNQTTGCGYCWETSPDHQGWVSCGYGSDGTPWFCPANNVCIAGTRSNPNDDFHCCPRGESCAVVTCQ